MNNAIRFNIFSIILTLGLSFISLIFEKVVQTSGGAILQVILLSVFVTLVISVYFVVENVKNQRAEKKFLQNFVSVFNAKKTTVKDFLLSCGVGIIFYLFYSYGYFAVANTVQYLKQEIVLYSPSVTPSAGLIVILVIFQGILSPITRSLFYQGSGTLVYEGYGKVYLLIPIALFAFQFKEIEEIIRYVSIGACALYIAYITRSVWNAAAFSLIQELPNAILFGKTFLPFDYRTCRSLEEALYFGLLSLGIALVLAAAALLVLYFINKTCKTERTLKDKPKNNKDVIFTFIIHFVVFVILILFNYFL